jgi:hypothetical protein
MIRVEEQIQEKRSSTTDTPKNTLAILFYSRSIILLAEILQILTDVDVPRIRSGRVT